MILGNSAVVGATLQVFATVTDPNGGAVIQYAWRQGEQLLAATPRVVIDLAVAEAINAGTTLRAEVHYRDGLGIVTTLTTALRRTTTIGINYPTQGAAVISGNAAFMPGTPYSVDSSALTDANGRGVVEYYWAVSADSGATWTALTVDRNENLTLHAEFFTGITRPHAPQLRAVLTHYDQEGFVQTLTSNVLTHRNQTLTGRLAINALQLSANGLVTVVEHPADADGIQTINYQWEAGNDLFFGVAAPIGGNQAHYRIAAADFNPQAVIRVVAEITDNYNNVQKITSNHVPIASRTFGALGLTVTGALRPGAIIQPQTTALYDANGGQIIHYRWQLNSRELAAVSRRPGEAYHGYTLRAAEVSDWTAGAPLTLVAVYADDLNYLTTLTATLAAPADISSQVATLGIYGPTTFAQNNRYTVRFASLTDANGLGLVTYQWYQSGGVTIDYAPIPGGDPTGVRAGPGGFSGKGK